MLKKIFSFILIVIILIAVGLAAYWYFDKQQGGSGIPLVGDNQISIGDLFPFGNGDTNIGTTTPIDSQNPDGTNPDQIPFAPPRLWQISERPQSGAITFLASTTESARTPFVRFVDKATGNIYESSLTLFGLKRITNTTIPKVYEAVWQPKADAVVLRYLDTDNETIRSTYAKLRPSAGQDIQELTTSFLPAQATNLAVHPSTGALAFVVEDRTSATVAVTKADTTGSRDIFKSAIKDVSVSWVGNTTLGLLSKPNANTAGQFYFLKTDTGELSRALGNRLGLVALANNDGTKILYSVARSNSLVTVLFDTKTGSEITAPFKTIPDKCVWSSTTAYVYCATPKTIPSAQYPDAWYQGKISFNDTLWRMNTATGATEFLIDPSITTETEFDATHLTLDPTETYVLFTNKKDAQLWGLRIQQ